MKIKRIISTHRNDFTAEMECEHCGHPFLNKYGYNDDYYHSKVIPAMSCEACGKNRAGTIVKEPNVNGTNHVGS